MAAEVESGFYDESRGLPWHGQGRPANGALRAVDVLREAGLDFTVSRRAIYAEATGREEGALVPVPAFAAICRDSDDTPYGVVGSRYVPAQNAEVLGFLDSMIGLGEAVYDSAWSLRGGQTVAISCLLGHEAEPVEGERIQTYLTAMNTHGGAGSIRFVVSPVRVVCMNTLRMAIAGATSTFIRRHTVSALSEKNLAAAREALGVADEYTERVDAIARELLAEAFTPREMGRLAAKLVYNNVSEPTPQQLKAAAALTDVYKGSPNLENIRATSWGALNAVAEWADYGMRYTGKNAADNRTESILFGRAADVKTRALELLR